MPVMDEDLVDLFHRELVQSYDPGLGSESRRQYAAGVLLAVHLHDEPRLMLTVHTPPVRMRHEMGAGLEKDLDDACTRHLFLFMRHFYEKSRHVAKPPRPQV